LYRRILAQDCVKVWKTIRGVSGLCHPVPIHNCAVIRSSIHSDFFQSVGFSECADRPWLPIPARKTPEELVLDATEVKIANLLGPCHTWRSAGQSGAIEHLWRNI
jgi:hypothetical protein